MRQGCERFICLHFQKPSSFFPPFCVGGWMFMFVSKDSSLFPSLTYLVPHCTADSCFQDTALAYTQKTRSLPRKVIQLKAEPSGPDHVTTRPSPSPRSALPQPPRSHGEPQRKVTKCFLFQPDHKGWKVPCGTTT